jgi:molybdopterin molybdotransferase
MEKLIMVSEAVEIIQNKTENFGFESIPFMETLGRVLAEDILADRDFPPFDRVSMDGIIINFNSYDKGQTKFKIEGIQAAGHPPLTLQNENNCLEAMTGGVLPKNADTVIQYEWLDIKDGVAYLNFDNFAKEKLTYCKNVHAKGKDRKQYDVLIKKGIKISSAEIGVFATVGKAKVLVKKLPKVMIVSTGDELVEVNEIPASHQIRRSNVWTLVSLLQREGIPAQSAHIADDKIVLKEKIAEFLEEFDVLMFSGAVSKGKFDFLPEILNELGVEKQFHKVKQRPGKPFWFGKKGTKTVFAFPGNPISTFVGCAKYFFPWYKKCLNIEDAQLKMAALTEDFTFKPNLHYFLNVQVLVNENGTREAIPLIGNGSGDLAILTECDGFLELPEGQEYFKQGESYPIIMYRDLN